MRRAHGVDSLAREKVIRIRELRVGKLEPATLYVREIDAQQREIGPVIPADQRGVDPLQARQRDREFDRARTGNMGVGQNKAVGRHDYARTDAPREPARSGIE